MNTRRNFLKRAGLATAGWVAGGLGTPSGATPSRRPHVILVFIDDMGWADLSCFGNREAKTPRIDQLAAEGIAFEQFYVNSPICSPSRVAISTGQYPQRWRIGSYLARRELNAQRGIADWLDPQAPMLAREFQRAGYATGHFGKWHMGGQRDVGDAPGIDAYGFDASLTNFEGLGPRVLPLLETYDGSQPRRHDLGSASLGRGPITWANRDAVTGHFVEGALAFMKKAVDAKKPFYINVWPDDVHSPFFPPEDRLVQGKRPRYLQVLEEMDAQLGKLFDAVRKDPVIAQNTLIVLCSDNGHEKDAGSGGPLRGTKASLFEGGVRSSLVVWGPGLIPKSRQGMRNKTSVFSAIDLVVSLYALTGVPAPSGVSLDGENLAETLIGQKQDSRQGPICFRRPPDRKQIWDLKDLPDLAIREGRWKLLCDYDGSRPLLFDLESDPGESTNLAASESDRVADLTKKILAWHRALPKDKGQDFA